MIEVKHDKPAPLISNEEDRRRIFSSLLQHHEDAAKHLAMCMTYPQKARWAERVEVYRMLSLQYCGEEIIG